MERTATISSCQIGRQLVLHVNVTRFSGMRRSAVASMAKASLAPVFRKQTAPRCASRNALGAFIIRDKQNAEECTGTQNAAKFSPEVIFRFLWRTSKEVALGSLQLFELFSLSFPFANSITGSGKVYATTADQLELTEENVELVLDDVRPYLMADGGNVEFVEIDGPNVYLRLQGACGSCPSSLTTMTMGIKRRLMEMIPDITDVIQIEDENQGMELTSENVDTVLDEIRPYLVGTGGGGLELVELDGPIAKVRITGPAASVMTVRVAVTQKLRERIPSIAAVQLVN
jgi:Fe-S cluster biogenesis protein NfuA